MMKKKIVCILLATLFALAAVGCSKGDSTVSFDDAMPWANLEIGNPNYEYTEYKIERLYVGGKEDVLVAEGKYTSELDRGGDNTTVKNTFELTYNDNEYTAYKNERGDILRNAGLTDRYQSEVTFSNDTLTPLHAQKTQTVAQRPLTDDAMPDAQLTDLPEGAVARYTLPAQVKYADPRSYAYDADYTADKVHFTTTVGTTTQDKDNGVYYRDYYEDPKDYTIKNNTRYDNEQLAYVVRAMSECKRKGSGTFYLSNFYDSYVNDKYVRYKMSLSCADKNTSTTLSLDPAQIVISDAEGKVDTEDGKYTISCVQASVSISSSTSGPAISLLVTDPSYTIAQTDSQGRCTTKVVVQMTFTEYSYSSAKVNYRTVYTLTSFRNHR